MERADDSVPPSPSSTATGMRWPRLELTSRISFTGSSGGSSSGTVRRPSPPTVPVPPIPPAYQQGARRDSAWKSGHGRDAAGSTSSGKDKKKESARFAGKLRLGNGTGTGKPIVPGEDGRVAWRAVKEAGGLDRWDITPDGGSAGREGRQFTVANVGHNGRIYLRPTIRPAHQRLPQPHFVLPMTPPDTAGLDALARERPTPDEGPQSAMRSPMTSTPDAIRPLAPVLARKPTRPQRRRALSESTIQEPDSGGGGGFKVVITKPNLEKARTAEDVDNASGQLLNVNIPSWKLGSPRFSAHGTPCIQGSSYAPSEDLSSNASVPNRSQRAFSSSVHMSESVLPSRRPSLLIPPLAHPLSFPVIQTPDGAKLDSPVSPATGRRFTPMPPHYVIEPAMFDALTLKPQCDDRSIVRLSPATGAVTAATPARLVAEVTSPNLLDYELLSDFFLTYRFFLEPGDLLQMLMARWRWALRRDDELGAVCRVRTFVAIRHWILNYFADDFVDEPSLRASFCDLLNQVIQELSTDERTRRVQVKILAELKKCWRRVCAQYWDGSEFDDRLGFFDPLAPGGPAAARERAPDAGPPQLGDVFPKLRAGRTQTSFYADFARTGQLTDSVVVVENRPSTAPTNPALLALEELRRKAATPMSFASVEAMSCSFAGKPLRVGVPHGSSHVPPAAHPVAASSVYTATVATTPRSLVGKRVRPSQSTTATHKRTGSLTDSLRDRGPDRYPFFDHDPAASVPFAGSLVRGNLLPPGQAFVDVSPSLVRHNLVPSAAKGGGGLQASAMSGPGMRRLIGSVRRALNKAPGMSPTQSTFIDISPLGPRGATTNRLPGTPIVPQARSLQQGGGRPPVRIDLLGAEVAEEFKKAVREDQAAEAERNRQELARDVRPSREPGDCGGEDDDDDDDDDDDAAAETSTRLDSLLPNVDLTDASYRPASEPILIDDALSSGLPAMSGALPVVNPSVEAFASALVPNGAGPTPPTTPPDFLADTPRRSSYLLNKHVIRPANATAGSENTVPPMPSVPSVASGGPSKLDDDDGLPRPSLESCRSQTSGAPSVAFSLAPSYAPSYAPSCAPSCAPSYAPSRPPTRARDLRMHRRLPSSRTQRSLNSIVRRRAASHHSALGGSQAATGGGIDAASLSEASDGAQDEPQPHRILRRRPGGDLRAAQNVGDLEPVPRRSRSLGSLTTYSDSLCGGSSYRRSPSQQGDYDDFADLQSTYSRDRSETPFSIGAMAEPARRHISLFSTHSSRPVLRPSFEAEALKLAQIPDDEFDDGGAEAALLKLEGKYVKTTHKLSMDLATRPGIRGAGDDGGGGDAGDEQPGPVLGKKEKREHRHLHVAHDAILASNLAPDSQDGGSTVRQHDSHPDSDSRPKRPDAAVVSRSFLAESFGESVHSARLAGPGDAEAVAPRKKEAREWVATSILRDPDDGSRSASDHRSFNNAASRVGTGSNGDGSSPGEEVDQSFLNEGSDDTEDSEISSEMSVLAVETQGPREATDGFPIMSSDAEATPARRTKPRPGPLDIAVPHGEGGLPSPPATFARTSACNASPEAANVPHPHERQIWEAGSLPSTPRTRPAESPRRITGAAAAYRHRSHDAGKYAAHLPFVLAFESEILAQQFTLIEKDALNEVDWKELINMPWKDSTKNDSRSWVGFLRNTDAHGVQVVIARFNIVVKWAVSEIVLTQDAEERARCIIKFIHIAAHCRRYRNFATLAQIAIALSSKEVSGLTRTWAMVPAADVATLRELEGLVSPTRNFHVLRAEMEAGTDDGCIPFVGIYTHDLLYNSQRPSEIATTPSTPPLVNFEKCRTTASTVKTLLRLLEASTLYAFQPIEGITERCLWMGALSDEEIRLHASRLE